MSGILSFQSGLPFNLLDYPLPDGELVDHYRPRVTGPLPALLGDGRMVPDRITPNQFLVLPLNAVRNASGCIPNAAPFACQLSASGPYEGTIGRNYYRQPGTHFQSVALMKNFDLSRVLRREGARLQYRAELYNVFNHSNLYVMRSTSVSAAPSFNTTDGPVRGVVASFGTPPATGQIPAPQEARQIVMALKLIF